MRLTLRTMLAYLDGILDPDDAQELGRRIEESEQATSILHRTQDVMRRLRLEAPSLTSDAPGVDPNTVAEYLDNTLQDDRVADLEKVCLESDVHLAEVASCHQILTLVLGEPAEIDPDSRQRMYGLVNLKHAEAVATPPPPPTKQDAATPNNRNGDDHADASAKPSRPKPAVPEYLRDPPQKKGRLLTVAVALSVVLCVVALGLYAAGQFEPGTRLGDLLRGDATVVADANDPAEPPPGPNPKDVEPPDLPVVDPTLPVEPADTVNQLPAPPLGVPPTEPGTELPTAPLPDALPDALPDGVIRPDSQTPTAPLPNTVHFPVPEPSEPLTPGTVTPGTVMPGTSTPDVGPQPDMPPVAPPSVPEQPIPEQPVTEPPGAGTPHVETPAVGATDVAAPEVVATLAADGQVLLRREPQSSIWQRVPSQAEIHSQTPLTSLPTFRPKIALSSGPTVQLVDGTEVELLPDDGQVPAGMKMVYGRAILTPGPDTPSRFRLQFGDRSGVIVFADPQSSVAVEVATLRSPGTDPEAKPVPRVARIYPSSGQVVWEDMFPQEGSGALSVHASLTVETGQCLVVDALPARPPVATSALPAWLTPDTSDVLSGRASKMVESALQANRSVNLSLIELLDHRLQEVDWLAVRSLGHIGVFEPMIAALDDPARKAAWPAWPMYIEQLTDSLARGPETAAQVHRAMVKQLGGDDEATDAYRMLWGYTIQQLRDGEGQTLVNALDHDRLAIRVLSFSHLEAATGLRLYYEPEQTAAKRRQPVRSWNERLQSKDFWVKVAER